jgi:hypothetical protein
MVGSHPPRVRQALGETLLDFACVTLALWTLSCHLVVALHGSLSWAIDMFGVGACALLIGLALYRHHDKGSLSETEVDMANGQAPPIPALALWPRAVGVALAVLGIAVFLLTRDIVLLWWSTVAGLLFGSIWVATDRQPNFAPARFTRRDAVILIMFGLIVVGITLVLHRWDADDVFYVGLAVDAADHPHLPLLQRDAMHGIAGLPLHLGLYRVQSWEMLMAAVSYLSRIPATYCFHWLAASIAAFLMPLSWARLFRTLVPSRWLWATATLIIVLLMVGDSPQWYGSFGPARIWQGKALFVSVLLPLLMAYGLEFGSRPNAQRGMLLAAAVVASVGATVNALWLAPVMAVLSVAAAAPPRRLWPFAFGGALLASGYAIATGLIMMGGAASELSSSLTGASVDTWIRGSTRMLGESNLLMFSMTALAAAWALSTLEPGRRFAALVPFAIWATVLNPYLATWVSAHVVGPFYWRAWWAMPVPALLALVLTLEDADRVFGPLVGRIASAGLVVGFVAFVPHISQFAADTGATLTRPRLKVPPTESRVAESLNREAGPRAIVVAPPHVGDLLPLLHHHAYPLEARHYLQTQREAVPMEELRQRRQMIAVADGRPVPQSYFRQFRHGLTRFAVAAVCFCRTASAPEIRAILASEGFHPQDADSGYETWVRTNQDDHGSTDAPFTWRAAP